MSKVKIFRVKGKILKPNYKTSFSKDLRALRPEDAVERIYAELGGQHGVKRVHIRIASVEEIKPEETEDSVIRDLSEG